MIEKLLALFVQVKTGAISGVFLLGASGALVSATTENGVTTITITQASPSPSASVSPSPSASTSPVPSASPSAGPSASPPPSASPSPSASAAPAARACVEAVQAVNGAFHDRHTTLSKMRSGKSERGERAARGETAAVLTVKRADEILKAIRQAAVRSIQAGCPSSHRDDGEDDEDDEDDDRDEDDGRASSGELLFTGTPAEIARQATAAMDLVMQAVAAQSPLPPSQDDDDDDEDDDDDDDDRDKKQKDKKQEDKGKAKGKRK